MDVKEQQEAQSFPFMQFSLKDMKQVHITHTFLQWQSQFDKLFFYLFFFIKYLALNLCIYASNLLLSLVFYNKSRK
jgi:hypothetical protein